MYINQGTVHRGGMSRQGSSDTPTPSVGQGQNHGSPMISMKSDGTAPQASPQDLGQSNTGPAGTTTTGNTLLSSLMGRMGASGPAINPRSYTDGLSTGFNTQGSNGPVLGNTYGSELGSKLGPFGGNQNFIQSLIAKLRGVPPPSAPATPPPPAPGAAPTQTPPPPAPPPPGSPQPPRPPTGPTTGA